MKTPLCTKELEVVKLLERGMRPSEIAKQAHIIPSSLYSIIYRLRKLKIVEKRTESYRVLTHDYLVIDDPVDLLNLRRRHVETSPEPYASVVLTDRVKQYIETHVQTPRSELATALGLPKYIVNREIIKMKEQTGVAE